LSKQCRIYTLVTLSCIRICKGGVENMLGRRSVAPIFWSLVHYINVTDSSGLVSFTHNKTNSLFHQEHNSSIWYCYLCTMGSHSTFYLCTLAWRWSKERPKHVAIVRYQYHILLLCPWLNKLLCFIVSIEAQRDVFD